MPHEEGEEEEEDEKEEDDEEMYCLSSAKHFLECVERLRGFTWRRGLGGGDFDLRWTRKSVTCRRAPFLKRRKTAPTRQRHILLHKKSPPPPTQQGRVESVCFANAP